MATAKTGSFYLTETVQLPNASPNGTRVTGVIDLGAYVNVPTGQAVAIESVDFIIQGSADFGLGIANWGAGDCAFGMQLTDLNSGTAYVRADDHSLIASSAWNIDTATNSASISADLFPDNFGPASLSEAFMVVNDSLYLTFGVDDAAVGGSILYGTARIRCRVVSLSKRDWMAIAIQSTASDN